MTPSSMPWSAAAARFAGVVIGAITVSWSAVIKPPRARGRHLRQVFQGTAVADQQRGGSRGEVAVAAQPGRHRLLPVVLGGLGVLGDADPAGDLGVEPVTG